MDLRGLIADKGTRKAGGTCAIRGGKPRLGQPQPLAAKADTPVFLILSFSSEPTEDDHDHDDPDDDESASTTSPDDDDGYSRTEFPPRKASPQ